MENNNENQKSSKSKFWLYFGIALAAIIIAFQLCSDDDSSDNYGSSGQAASSQWAGTYEQSPWKFVLRQDGSATVRSTEDFEYETSWEDGGNWAVVGAFNGEAFLIDKSGNLSIMGSDGHTTGLLKLRKTK